MPPWDLVANLHQEKQLFLAAAANDCEPPVGVQATFAVVTTLRNKPGTAAFAAAYAPVVRVVGFGKDGGIPSSLTVIHNVPPILWIISNNSVAPVTYRGCAGPAVTYITQADGTADLTANPPAW